MSNQPHERLKVHTKSTTISLESINGIVTQSGRGAAWAIGRSTVDVVNFFILRRGATVIKEV